MKFEVMTIKRLWIPTDVMGHIVNHEFIIIIDAAGNCCIDDDELDIGIVGKSVYEAIAALMQHLEFMYNCYVAITEGALTDDAIKLRNKFKAMLESPKAVHSEDDSTTDEGRQAIYGD